LERGSAVTVNCQVNDNTAEVFLWHKFSKNTPVYEMPTDEKKLYQQGMSFTLINVSYHDNGVYECVAISRDGRRRATHEIANVIVRTRK